MRGKCIKWKNMMTEECFVPRILGDWYYLCADGTSPVQRPFILPGSAEASPSRWQFAGWEGEASAEPGGRGLDHECGPIRTNSEMLPTTPRDGMRIMLDGNVLCLGGTFSMLSGLFF